ncbi:hypothetical protein OCUAc20_17750 [Acinetobacter baumannii]|nr:hypothetical protein OCUAc20_17750 [Acinetobacter baumannii]
MIETERLILRQWKESDSEPFIKMGLDEDVMRFFPKLLPATESISLIQRISALIDENGWGFWAVELKETQEFIGFIGLHNQPEQFDFSPALKLDGELLQNTGKKVMPLKEQKQHWSMPLIFSIKIKWFLSQQQ